MKRDPLLALHWRASKVRTCLHKKDRIGLVAFLKERHEERFFRPIRHLCAAENSQRGFGFAAIALCCLLIEMLQSYWDGLPTTNGREFAYLRNLKATPAKYRLPAHGSNGKEAFKKFFRRNKISFHNMSGVVFYRNVRNGLLHQAQTKRGWTIKQKGSSVCDISQRIIFRDNFAENLEQSFNEYLIQLGQLTWDSRPWQNAARKIWWLVRLS